MSYWIKYFVTDSRDVSRQTIRIALKAIDKQYELDDGGLLAHGHLELGILDVNYPHDRLFLAEIEENRAKIDEAIADDPEYYADEDVPWVLNALSETKAIIVLNVFLSGGTADELMDLIDPLWRWLDSTGPGLLHVENIGFERNFDLILEVG